jgi:hypothetical protein
MDMYLYVYGNYRHGSLHHSETGETYVCIYYTHVLYMYCIFIIYVCMHVYICAYMNMYIHI